MVALILVVSWIGLADSPEPPGAGETSTEVRFEKLGSDRLRLDDLRSFGWRWEAPRIRIGAESYVVVVPETYAKDNPHGLLVYISPGKSGWMSSQHLGREALTKLLEEHHLLYVGANDSGNERHPPDRLQLALTAVESMKQHYSLDESRVIVAGMSGGAKMALIAARVAPRIFSGSIAIVGASFHRTIWVDNSNDFYPADMKLSPAAERLVRSRVAFAILTGPKDFKYISCLRIEEAFRASNYRSLLIDVPGLDHTIPGPEPIDEALRFVLDGAGPQGAVEKTLP